MNTSSILPRNPTSFFGVRATFTLYSLKSRVYSGKNSYWQNVASQNHALFCYCEESVPLSQELRKTNRRSKEIFDIFMIVFGVLEQVSINSLLTLGNS